MEDRQFHQVLDRFGFSRTGFRRVRKGVKKRLARHMQETGCRDIADYIGCIERDREVRLEFERLMTVSISRFFRDRRLWETLQERILPVLVKNANQVVKVWSAGCASGEEVYTFRILWEGLRKSYSRLPDLSILATDMNPAVLNRAKAAVYPPSSMREIPEAIRAAYFEISTGGNYAVSPRLRKGITWQVHHLLSDPPGSSFDLVFLRNNLLTYYRDEIKIPAFSKVIDRLPPGGFLVIGSHERIPDEPPVLKPRQDSANIFYKQYSNPIRMSLGI